MGFITAFKENQKAFIAYAPVLAHEELVLNNGVILITNIGDLHLINEMKFRMKFRSLAANEDELHYVNTVVADQFYEKIVSLPEMNGQFQNAATIVVVNNRIFFKCADSLEFMEINHSVTTGNHNELVRGNLHILDQTELSMKEKLQQCFYSYVKYSESDLSKVKMRIIKTDDFKKVE